MKKQFDKSYRLGVSAGLLQENSLAAQRMGSKEGRKRSRRIFQER